MPQAGDPHRKDVETRNLENDDRRSDSGYVRLRGSFPGTAPHRGNAIHHVVVAAVAVLICWLYFFDDVVAAAGEGGPVRRTGDGRLRRRR